MRRFFRPAITLFFDGVMATLAFWSALWIRYDGQIPEQAQIFQLFSLNYGLLCMVTFYLMGLHRTIWRYTSARDLMRLGTGTVFTFMFSLGAMFLMTRLEFFPRTAFIIMPLLHISLAAGPRIFMRLLHDKPFQTGWSKVGNVPVQNVILFGANDAADLFIRELGRQHPAKFHVIGILDEDKTINGRLIHNIPVMGNFVSLGKVLDLLDKKNKHVDTLILTDQSQMKMRGVLAVAKERGIDIKRLPSLSSLKSGEKLTDLKPVFIEDLLGRAAIKLDMTPVDDMISGKCVIVTGAGGSIGSEICRQVAARQPSLLVLADHSEFALYQIDHEFSRTFPDVPHKTLLIDVKNSDDVNNMLDNFKADIILHAAAYKHVPMVENNPIAGIENNLIGTSTVAKAAMAHQVGTMVMISTDKAVNPTNVMGATKRAAEIFCQAQEKTPTKFISVRFGNVLGSTGSVIPLFKRQIREGGPLTVTHKEATRYFMTIPEAVQLTMQAAAMGGGGEVFMLDMGDPIRIWDLAEQMIRLSGLTPYEDIDIKEVGLRPGEKLFEELWYDNEAMGKTVLSQVFLVKPIKMTITELNERLHAVITTCKEQNNFSAVNALKKMVTEFTSSSNSPYADAEDKQEEL